MIELSGTDDKYPDLDSWRTKLLGGVRRQATIQATSSRQDLTDLYLQSCCEHSARMGR